MKLLINGMIFCLLLGFTSCTQLSDDISMTCKVDGEDFEATVVVATIQDDDLVVTGSGGLDEQVEIYIRDCTATGTYNIDINSLEDNVGGWTAGLEVETDVFLSSTGTGSGSITISTLTDTNVEGTFEFTAMNSQGTEVEITEGAFQATIK